MKKLILLLIFSLNIPQIKAPFSSENSLPLLAVAITPIEQGAESLNNYTKQELSEKKRKEIIEWGTLVALCNRRNETVNPEPWRELEEKKATERELQLILAAEETWV